jgi:DNA polymerase-3 subunit gamma/tau
MALVRLCHAANLPTPDEAVRMLRDDPAPPPAAVARTPTPAGAARGNRGQQASAVAAEPVAIAGTEPSLLRFEDVIERARLVRDLSLVRALERHVRPVRFEPGRIEIALTADAEPDLPQRLGQVLREWTNERWLVAVTKEAAGHTVHEQRAMNRAAMLEDVRADPLVRQVLDRFPGAEIVEVRERAAPDAGMAEIVDDAPIATSDED